MIWFFAIPFAILAAYVVWFELRYDSGRIASRQLREERERSGDYHAHFLPGRRLP